MTRWREVTVDGRTRLLYDYNPALPLMAAYLEFQEAADTEALYAAATKLEAAWQHLRPAGARGRCVEIISHPVVQHDVEPHDVRHNDYNLEFIISDFDERYLPS